MTIFDFLTMLGGLSLFLFGMSLMGQALERRAGSGLRNMIGSLTTKPAAGVLTGIGVTAVIQSSSATTVMVIGFVNSGLMTLRQAIHVIMGANVGTTVTAWILSLGGIDGNTLFLQLLKPSSFTPVLALVGIVMYMFCRSGRKKDTGMIFLGFATLMFGMETMTGAVVGLKNVPAFTQMFVAFENPFLGVLAGAVLTAIIQSSSASVGILQALAATGCVSYGAAIPIIMGQNIGTCITAILSAIGANKNAKRAAAVHLSFNLIGTAVWLAVYCLADIFFQPAIFGESATLAGIATVHSLFNILCLALMLPLTGALERMVTRLVPDHGEKNGAPHGLDERLLATPPIALERCHSVAVSMAKASFEALDLSLGCILHDTARNTARVRELEEETDRDEDSIGTFLVRLSESPMAAEDSLEATKLLKLIGDFERIADHAVNIVEAAEEMREKKFVLSFNAERELTILMDAVREIAQTALEAFLEDDEEKANRVEPLEQVIDQLKEQMRTRHILRLQAGNCTMEAGFVWSDLLTNLERASDHCSNIAGCVIDMKHRNMNLHQSLRAAQTGSSDYARLFAEDCEKYQLPIPESEEQTAKKPNAGTH